MLASTIIALYQINCFYTCIDCIFILRLVPQCCEHLSSGSDCNFSFVLKDL